MQYCIIGGATTSPSNTVTQYTALNRVQDGSWNATESSVSERMAAPGVIRRLSVFLTTAPGAGIQRVFTVYVNGVATAATVTFANTNGWNAIQLSSPVIFNAGDLVSLQAAPVGGTATSTGNIKWHVVCEGQDFSLGSVNTQSASSTLTEYLSPLGQYARAWSSVQTDLEIIVPCAGRIDRLYVDSVAGTVGAGGSYTLTVQKNGVDTVLTATIAANTSSASDLLNSFTVAAGDKIVIKKTPSGTPTARGFKFAARFRPDTFGEFFVGMGSAIAPSTTVTNYTQVNGLGSGAWTTAQSNAQLGLPANVTVSNIYVSMPTAPGAGKSWTDAVYRNGVSTIPVTISGTSTSGNASAGSFTSVANDLIAFGVIPSGTPTASGGHHVSSKMSMPAISEGVVNFGGAECQTANAPHYGGADSAGGSISVVASPFSGGGYAYRVNPTTTGTGSFLFSQFGTDGYVYDVGMNSTQAYYEFRFRCAQKSSAVTGEQIFDCRVLGASKASVRLLSSGLLAVYDSTNTLVATGSTVIADNTDYHIGFSCGTGASAAYELRVNGVTELTGTLNSGTTRHYGIRIGKQTDLNGTTVDYYYDDVICSDTGFSNGIYRVGSMLPDSTVSIGSWTGGPNPDDYTQIDDYSDSTTYLKASAAGSFYMGMQDRSAAGMINGTVVALKPYAVVRADSASGSGSVDLLVTTTAGGAYDGTSPSKTYTTTETLLQWCLAKIPGTASTAWTSSEVDGVQQGLYASATGIRCSSLWNEALFIPGKSGGLLLLGVG